MPEQNKIDVAEPDRGADSGRGGQLLLYLLAEELEYTSDYRLDGAGCGVIADMLFWIGFWSRCNTAAETIPDGVKSGMEKTLKRTNFIFILAVLYAVCAVAAYVILGAESLVLAALVIIGPLYIVSELVRIVLRAKMSALLKS